MKKLNLMIMAMVLVSSSALTAQVAINSNGSSADPSAMLEVESSDKGFLPPRLTTGERDAISSPADGLLIFNTTTNCIEYYAGGYWYQLCGNQHIQTVTNTTTGETWMDRNLGAYRVALSSSDPVAYGDLYQWGRLTDGHQSRYSGTISTLSTTNVPGHGDYILTSTTPFDWRDPQNDDLWQGVSGINNPCPAGFRLPTQAEWEAERSSWASNNAAGAFGSVLKLPVAGYRTPGSGDIGLAGSVGLYASSTVNGIYAWYLHIAGSEAYMAINQRAIGYSVRCIQD